MRTATPVNFTLDLNGRTGPRSSQVAHALIDAIACGRVHDGDRLPSTRTLAAAFGLARTAVVAAYEELTAAGFLVARPGGSTYVERGAAAAARVRVDGSRSPSWIWPRAIASISACASWLDLCPDRPFRSSVKLTGVAVRITPVCGTVSRSRSMRC